MGLDMARVKPGTKVRCISGYDRNPGGLALHQRYASEMIRYPESGKEYTVREVKQYTNGAPSLLFVEIHNRLSHYEGWGMCEPTWNPTRFDLVG